MNIPVRTTEFLRKKIMTAGHGSDTISVSAGPTSFLPDLNIPDNLWRSVLATHSIKIVAADWLLYTSPTSKPFILSRSFRNLKSEIGRLCFKIPWIFLNLNSNCFLFHPVQWASRWPFDFSRSETADDRKLLHPVIKRCLFFRFPVSPRLLYIYTLYILYMSWHFHHGHILPRYDLRTILRWKSVQAFSPFDIIPPLIERGLYCNHLVRPFTLS